MSKDQKPRRPASETPKGFRDYFGVDVTERRRMLDRIAAVYERYGFDALETPAVETVEALGKFLPDVERPNAGVFAWQEAPDSGGDWLALRYDLTAPLARVAAQYRNDLPSPYRRYAMGPVWRNEKPGPGRYRQFYQCDADTVGSASPAADAEMIMMLTEALGAAGLLSGDYVVRLNSRKVLNGVLDAAGVAPELTDDVLRQIDKFDKMGVGGVRQLLTSGRRDESGAFVEGLGMKDGAVERVLAFLTSRGENNAATLNNLAVAVGDSAVGAEGVAELRDILGNLGIMAEAGGWPEIAIIDPSVVRGLGYYTGAVFEAELTFTVLDDKGRERRFGSVAGGGRYDGLVERFTGQRTPATGISIGVDRLLAALRDRGRGRLSPEGPVVITVMDPDRMADYQVMVAELRGAGVRAEVYLGNPKNFGAQMRYADKRASPLVIVQGRDDEERGVIKIKDMVLGAEIASRATVDEWRAQPAQIEVARGELVNVVSRMLARL